MPKLRNRIIRYLSVITMIVFVIVLVILTFFRINDTRTSVERDASIAFTQIEKVLADNEEDLEQLKESYFTSSEQKARAAAYAIDNEPDSLYDATALVRIAELLEVDEIHIFDEKGVIISGTKPEYYGKSMNIGEQISYFKPMLKDKTLSMVQDIMPNTIELKSMQYSAVWNETGEFIVQIGLNPDYITRATEKNSLSHIFSLLRVGVGVDICAVDMKTNIIKGSTNSSLMNRTMYAVGLPKPPDKAKDYSTFATLNGVDSYCVYTVIQDKYICFIVTKDTLFNELISETLITAGALLLIAIILVISVTWYLNRYVINSIKRINSSLAEITIGKLDTTVNVSNSEEFSQLSSHINDMVSSLLSTTDVMSYIINKTGSYVGVYVYNSHMKYVRFTDYIPELLKLDTDEMADISSDYHLFKDYIRVLRSKPMPGEKNIYVVSTAIDTRYIRIDEAMHNNDVLGVVIDMTSEIEKRRRLETERDIDLLTGLLNRRGLKLRLSKLFNEPQKLGHGALFMIDADDLKKVNDLYGHSQGDRYLKALADVLKKFGSKNNVSARLGGDEFVLFLYGYETNEDLMEDVRAVVALQDMITTILGEDEEVLVRFSLGYTLTYGQRNHTALLKEADDLMYENKRQRKGDER